MKFSRIIPVALLMVLSVAPHTASAASSFEVTGWLPYWRGATSTNDVMPHLDLLTEINPFVYTLKSDGTIVDNGKMDQEPWLSLIAAAKAKNVRVIPTIMNADGDFMHGILSSASKRVALENQIAALVKAKGFDGIDIDFESKKAEDKNNFSTFLKGLSQRLETKWLMCTIESRTPIDSRYYGADIPTDAQIYANDFVQINKYCDRVRIMAYDQQGIDQSLTAQAASSSQLYAPVADPVWVKKTVDLAAKQISRNKILIGVPTYGYEYDVTAYSGGEYMYKILWTFNPGYATQIANQYGVTGTRNTAGEMTLTYTPNVTSSPTVSSAANSGMLAALAAEAYAQAFNSHQTFRMLDWPDAVSIAQKIKLAQDLGVRGVSIFKLDGGEDQGIWNALNGVRGTIAQKSAATVVPSGSITLGLGLGSNNSQVKTLQVILNSDPDTQIAASGPGSPGNETTKFGPATKIAVQKFQVKYGIASKGSSAYGYVGPSTRAKLNELNN